MAVTFTNIEGISMEPQSSAPQPSAPTSTTNEDPGKTLGIVGLVLAFLLPLIGLILSIVGVSKSKKAGFKNTPGVIGIIVGAVLAFIVPVFILLVVFLSIPALQRNTRNTQYKNDVATVQASLESYRAENGGRYPGDLSALSASTPDTSAMTYSAEPAGCTTDCKSYTLSIMLEGPNGGQVYTVTSN